MGCSNPEIGKLINDYLEGKLSRHDSQIFQKHFLECDECFDKVDFELTLSNIIDDRKQRTEAEDPYRRKAAAGTDTPKRDTNDNTVSAKKILRAEEKIRAKYKLSEIKSYLHTPDSIIIISKELNFNVAIIKSALLKATDVFALFTDESDNEKGFLNNIEINLHQVPKGEKGYIKVLGNLTDKLEERKKLPDETVRITSLKSILEAAIEKAANASFYYIQELQRKYTGTYDQTLSVSNYGIECNFDGYLTVDGPSIGLSASIAIISSLIDLPTKKAFAFTGTVERQTGHIGHVANVITKVKTAVSEEIDDIIIPESNFEKEKELLESLCESNTQIYHKALLSEVVETVFDIEKIKEVLIAKKKL